MSVASCGLGKDQVNLPKQAYTIDEFCAAHSICRASFYNLQRAGSAPAIMRVGGRRLISVEAAAAWRRAMEAGPEAA
jgi:hypothetical protein